MSNDRQNRMSEVRGWYTDTFGSGYAAWSVIVLAEPTQA